MIYKERLERRLGISEFFDGFKTYFSWEEAIEPITELINTAESSITVRGSDLGKMSDLGLTQALESAGRRGVTVQIEHGPETQEEREIISRLRQEEKVVLYPLERRPESHFIIVDGKHSIIEEPPKIQKGGLLRRLFQPQIRRLFIKHDSAFSAQRIESDFRQRHGL